MKTQNIAILTALMMGSIANNSFASNPVNGAAQAAAFLLVAVPAVVLSGTIGAVKMAKLLAPYGAEWGAKNGAAIGRTIAVINGAAVGFTLGCMSIPALGWLINNPTYIPKKIAQNVKNLVSKNGDS